MILSHPIFKFKWTYGLDWHTRERPLETEIGKTEFIFVISVLENLYVRSFIKIGALKGAKLDF